MKAKTIKYPTIKEISLVIRFIKPDICDDYLADDETIPGIDITIGHDPKTGEWDYQTGDNSFTGGAYGYPNWAVGRVYRRTNSRGLAKDLIDQLHNLNWQ